MTGVAALLLPLLIFSAFFDTSMTAFFISLAVLAAVEIFCIPIAVHNYVELREEALLIVFGLIRREIPYRHILALSTTNNPTSSLGASLDRIEIRCINKADVMISIMDKERFFSEIKKRNPGIIVRINR